MSSVSRRAALAGIAAAVGTATTGLVQATLPAPEVRVENPRCRVPLSFIIDDSTCLVNMGKFCMPQFAATYPQRASYQKPWRSWPDEIPDDFVRKFADWCGEHQVKGKYSIVPYPACVGWLDRNLPGWSQASLRESLALVRNRLLSNWDIHPEMITHTRVIDLKTGRPFADYSPSHMENSYPQQDVSVDYLASYLAYALKILKNCDLPCEGITTPGGFGNRVKDKLPLAVGQAVRDVYDVELPHYFKYIAGPGEPTFAKLEAQQHESGPVMNVLAGTGDWFGGWDGSEVSQPDRYCNRDGTSGRMAELIRRGEPAIMLCHWPGMICNGDESGYRAFQNVVLRLAEHFSDQTVWMKLSEIGRYEAAKQTTRIERDGEGVKLKARFASPAFTISSSVEPIPGSVSITHEKKVTDLRRVATRQQLVAGTWCAESQSNRTCICFDLQRGDTLVEFA